MESPPHFPSRNRSASALLLVLGLIVLVSVVVLAFFASATTERTAAHTQANSEAARNLSNNALQFAMAQISDGTKGGTAQAPLAWASQPGMIRTYDSSGNPHRYHKLYSAQNMTVSNPASFSVGEDAPPADWRSSPAVWTDLNAPVAGVDGTLNYPILDPAALTGTASVQPSGFSITNPPGYTGGNSTADNNRAPMPVRWLYQLKDGTMVPGVGAGNTATVAGATAANPIVGRLAFWTDDETCKVNINTAAEGTYWDTPRFQPGSQVNLGAVMQGNPRLPVQSEAWHASRGDGATGRLISPEFKIEKPLIAFLIAGGRYEGVQCINLLVDNKVVRTATGENSDTMAESVWDVADLKGKTARIEIVDGPVGGNHFAHLGIDQIEFRDK